MRQELKVPTRWWLVTNCFFLAIEFSVNYFRIEPVGVQKPDILRPLNWKSTPPDNCNLKRRHPLPQRLTRGHFSEQRNHAEVSERTHRQFPTAQLWKEGQAHIRGAHRQLPAWRKLKQPTAPKKLTVGAILTLRDVIFHTAMPRQKCSRMHIFTEGWSNHYSSLEKSSTFTFMMEWSEIGTILLSQFWNEKKMHSGLYHSFGYEKAWRSIACSTCKMNFVCPKCKISQRTWGQLTVGNSIWRILKIKKSWKWRRSISLYKYTHSELNIRGGRLWSDEIYTFCADFWYVRC